MDILNSRRQYAPGVKNLEAKTNPGLVSWEHLPENERKMDQALVSNIVAFLGRAGFQLAKK